MKLLFIVIPFIAQLAFAGDAGGDASHHDWNKVMPQPVADTTKSELPSPTKILEPKFMTKLKGPSATLKWEAIEGTEYYLQVATDAKFKWLLVDSPNMKVTEYQLNDLKAGQQYFWRVFTQKPKNWAGYTKGAFVKSMFQVIE
jgi:hypothetical protein